MVIQRAHGTPLARHHLLGDGRLVTVRRAVPSDAPALSSSGRGRRSRTRNCRVGRPRRHRRSRRIGIGRGGRGQLVGIRTGRGAGQRGLIRAVRPLLPAAVLARLLHERCGARARVPGARVRAGDGVGAPASHRADRARGRAGGHARDQPAPPPAGVSAARRARRDDAPCTIRCRRARVRASTVSRTWPRWRRRSTTCSIAWSPSDATARAAR